MPAYGLTQSAGSAGGALAIDGFIGNILNAFDRLSALASSTCGGCGKDFLHNRPKQEDPALTRVFAIRGLSQGGPEATRATQRGARLLHEGRTEEALREMHDARQLAPNSHEACCNLACVYHSAGEEGAALHWYREARRLAPRDEVAVLAQAILESRRGAPEEAHRLLMNFLQDVDASSVGALRQLGRLHIREEQWSKAAGCFHRLIAIDPSNEEWPQQLQLCLSNLPVKNEFAEPVQNPSGLPGMFALAVSFAEPLLRGAMPPDGREGPGGLPAGGAATASSKGRGGVGRGGGLSPRGGAGGPGRAGLATIQEAGQPGAAKLLEEARQLLEVGRAEPALPLYERVLQHEPRNQEAQSGLVECYAELSNWEAALEVAKRLVSARPDDIEVNLRVAELLLIGGYSAEMVEPYLKWAGSIPASARALKLRMLCAQSEVALLREDSAKAHASASEAVRIDAESPKALLLLGHARLRVAEYAAALRALGAALDVAGARCKGGEGRRLRATAHALAAEAYERQRQYPQALTEVQKALELVPTLYSARVVRATALHQSSRCREAETELEEILRQDPRNAAARLQLGYCQLCNGDPRAAGTLEALITSAGTSRTTCGNAKIYLGLALDMQAERTYDLQGEVAQRAQLMVKEGLVLHRNLQHVWREIEGKPAGQPLEAVQRLRGICDLDLTSVQAKQLFRLLALAAGRHDLVQGLGGSAPSPWGTLGGGHSGSASRDSSVAPSRWAPMGGFGRGAHSGASTPLGTHGTSTPLGTSSGSHTQWHAGCSPNTPQQAYRGRSVSPTPARSLYAGGYGGQPQQRGRQSSRDASPMPHTPSTLGDPLTIGWNELIRPEQLVFGPQLGAGGSAQVYRGSWNGQEVAIKKISGRAHLEEMRKEVNALRRLRHPRLVRFIGACVQPPLLLVVTEFMPGGSLHDRLFGARRDPPLGFMQRWLIACQMAEGLTFLHSQRVVHRDLKSMNILLDAQSSAKICDFGLAQQMTEMCTHIARKIDGEEGGSPRYMAPECYDAAHGKITEKVDIWAMGCILIELFGGVLPYGDCQTMAQLSARILIERRSPDVPACVPQSMAPLIQACVNFDAARRPSAGELQGELGQLRPA